MVHVRQSIYSLLKRGKVRQDMVNLLGNFDHLEDDCELYPILKSLGIRKINEISRCKDFEEYMDMGNANFNIVLNPEARYAAADLQKRLKLPSIELTRLYQIDKIRKQYSLFGGALGVSIDDSAYYEETIKQIEEFRFKHKKLTFSVGEGCNANAFELSLALLRYDFSVAEIFADPMETDYVYLKKIAALSPETRIYSNLEPSMIYYDSFDSEVDIVVGKDAGYYYPQAAKVEWSKDIQPFGYAGLRYFFEECEKALAGKMTKIEEGEK